jgi:hypothetical protein
MFKNWRPFITFLALGLMICGVRAQAPAKPDPKPDYSKEAFVIEQTSMRIAFENDGTGIREYSGRIRIQSDAVAEALEYARTAVDEEEQASTKIESIICE